MKKLFYILVSIFITTNICAQEGKISIDQDAQIAELLEIYKKNLDNNDYYRIQVGFVSNNAKAQEIKSNVEIDFPDLPSQIDFDSPTYRIRVGRFKSKLEAERKFNEVRKKYPNAMLLKPKKST
ncbi:SPOR domain-containing protein [Maribacter cobaltidurans]|uniref:Translation initiation factor IF-2 n=1 Tax=Maribacter cobaltidurans TaxID=1178778 RepID=A0A223V304_9FLAO|nr:SPOR domain-containing protein [Maribacter cobaltidurans]ASV29500.1 translation initiation factor IF-2 [Maribacter cobaltidurans]GGD68487.1 sporulation protein [Maribacter cobaltidurans]